MISIVIPAFNEEKRIGDTLSLLKRTVRQKHEVVVVCEGSDATARIARRLGARVFHFKERLGKGKAMRIGISKAKGEVVILYDADAATPPTEIPKLLRALEKADVAIGTRYSNLSKIEISKPRLFTGLFFNLLARLLFGLGFSDTQCGFKGLRRNKALELVEKAKTNGFVWDVELLYRAKKMRVVEVPISWHEVGGGTLSGSGLKIVFKMLFELLTLRLAI